MNTTRESLDRSREGASRDDLLDKYYVCEFGILLQLFPIVNYCVYI